MTALVTLSVVVLVGGTLLSLYAAGDLPAPAGFDTSHYVWRANLVAGEGLGALPDSSPFAEHADRAGFVVVAAMVRSISGISPFDLAFVLPALMGTLVGLGAGAFAVRVLGEPRWSIPVYGVMVGASSHVVVTAVPGLLDNLILDAVVMAAAVAALLAAGGQRSTVAALVLVAAATLTHWPLTVVFLALLAALAMVLLPAALNDRRAGRTLLDTPSGRLAALVAGSAAIVGAGVGSFGSDVQPPGVRRAEWMQKLASFVLQLRLWYLAPAAVLGMGSLAATSGDESDRRRGFALLLVWAGAVAVSVALMLLGLDVPGHRMLLFGLAIPMLAAAGVVAVIRRVRGLPQRMVGSIVGAMVVIVALGGTVVLGRLAWYDGARESFVAEGFIEATQAGRYLEAIGNRRPVVFVIQPEGLHAEVPEASTLAFGAIRSGLPSDQIRLAHTYLGDVRNLLEGRPTLRPGDRAYNETSLKHWLPTRPLLPRRPVVLLLSSLNPSLETSLPESLGQAAAPGVFVVRGSPPPSFDGAVDAPGPPSAAALAGRFGVVLVLLAAAGIGWAVALLPPDWFLRASLTPALGLAAVVVLGTILGRVGLDAPATRPWIAAGVALLGWGVVAARVRWGAYERRPLPQR